MTGSQISEQSWLEERTLGVTYSMQSIQGTDFFNKCAEAVAGVRAAAIPAGLECEHNSLSYPTQILRSSPLLI